MLRSSTAAAALAISLLAGCGRPAVDDTLLEMEARNPVVADLDLATADRTDFNRSGASIRLGYDVDGSHVQIFEPIDDNSLDDVTAEVISIAETAGWEMDPRPDRWCANRPDQRVSDLLRVTLVSDDERSHVQVSLSPMVTGGC